MYMQEKSLSYQLYKLVTDPEFPLGRVISFYWASFLTPKESAIASVGLYLARDNTFAIL